MSDNRENKHNEEPHDSEEEKYSFLQETVKDEQRSKKGIMGNLCRLAGRGLILDLQQACVLCPSPMGDDTSGRREGNDSAGSGGNSVENETDTKNQDSRRKRFSIRI